MPADDVVHALKEIGAILSNIEHVLDLDTLRKQIAELEAQASVPDLWSDPEKAQAVTSKMSYVQNELRRISELRRRYEDLQLMYEMSEEEDDAQSLADADKELTALGKAVRDLEVRTLLSGEYDRREAVMTVAAGAGGVDAADFAEMLLRMYTRYFERHNWTYDVLDTSYAEEAGLKSATVKIKAPYAFGTLSVEGGTHRLVRISPFDNQGRRQTSFAKIEVVPVVEQTDHIDIPDDEIRIDVYRSSGPGGQGVNTTDSAVRITHLATGIVVSCQNERSQIQNRASAMAVLASKLLDRKRQEERAKLDSIRDDSDASWGNQMRSYVLHPYQMVKDLRTEHETGNTAAVLDGEIDDFIEAGIRWRKRRERDDAQN